MRHRSFLKYLVSRVAVSVASLILTTATTAGAYSEAVHKQIVLDAMEFIISSSGEKTPYVDGSTGRSDYELLRAALNGDNARLRALARDMAEASAATDQMQDVWLKIPGLFGSTSRTEVGGVYFTTFSHFINVRDAGVLWPESGYSYQWVAANPQCTDADFEDRIANFFIAHGGARVDTPKSEALIRYRDPLAPNVGGSDYVQHFDQEIRYVHFWPLTNLATYRFDKFLTTPKGGNGAPENLPWVGPVLHAAADSTVPYHAAGLSGCGHGVYEDGVERLYSTGRVFDRGRGREYLTKASHLKASASVADIVLGNAWLASGAAYCKCGLNSCDCPVARKEHVAKELTNLAIASTVTIMRKAFSEWLKSGAQSVAGGAPPRGRVSEPKEQRFYEAMSAVPVWPVLILTKDPGVAKAMEGELLERMTRMRDVVAALERRQMEAEAFRRQFEGAVSEIEKTVTRFPNAEWNPLAEAEGAALYPGLPKIGDRPIRFRLPTLEEMQAETAWRTYRLQRRRFFDARGLYTVGITRGAVEGRIWRLKAEEKSDAEGQLGILKNAQELYIRALAGSP